MTDDRAGRVSALLHEAGETHHLVYRIVDGDDPDWASWYTDWLINLSELPEILGTKPVSLDKDFAKEAPQEQWPQWYAQRLIEHFTPAA